MTYAMLLRRVAFIISDVSEYRIASIIVTRIGELETKLAVTRSRSTLVRKGIVIASLPSVLRLLVAPNCVFS
jgi:hypothetical protein